MWDTPNSISIENQQIIRKKLVNSFLCLLVSKIVARQLNNAVDPVFSKVLRF